MRIKTFFTFLLSALLLVSICGCNRSQNAGNRSDGDIANDVQGRINADANLPNKQITVNANNGVVTLNGTAASDTERLSAANDAASVNGVKTVVNNIEVAPANGMASNTAPTTPMASSSTRRTRPVYRSGPNGNPMSANRANNTAARNNPSLPTTVTVPSGTNLTIRTIDAIDSEKSNQGDTFAGTLDAPIEIDGRTVVPRDADVRGRVVEVKSAGHFKGASLLVLDLTSLSYNGHSYRITTDKWQKQGAARGRNTAEKVGGGAALGAIIGAIAGGGKGAAIGAGTGAAVGTGAQVLTHGQQILLKPETLLTFNLAAPVSVSPSAQTRGGGTVLSPNGDNQQPQQ